MKLGDIVNLESGWPFVLVRKDGLVWTWLNLSIGEAFEIRYTEAELEDPHVTGSCKRST